MINLVLELFKIYLFIFIIMIGIVILACLLILFTALVIEMIKDLKRG